VKLIRVITITEFPYKPEPADIHSLHKETQVNDTYNGSNST